MILPVVPATCAAFTLPQMASAGPPRCQGEDATNDGTGYDSLNGYWGDDTCIHGEDNQSCEA
jgi:hypothetical protein